MKVYFENAFVAAITYFISVQMGFFIYSLAAELPPDRNRIVSGLIIGFIVMVVTYGSLGAFLGQRPYSDLKQLLKITGCQGLFVVIGERVSLYLIGWVFTSTGADGWRLNNWFTPVQFVRSEALPYFSIAYILYRGICSLLLCSATAWAVRRRLSTSS